ncbi:MAG: phosphate ABC transporter substrate-binding protein [Candidatus Thiodiazotropha sp.]
MKLINKALLVALLMSSSMVVEAGVVVVVGASSSLGDLTQDQVADIFLGKTSKFPDGSQAVPIDQEDGADIRADFYKKVTGKSGSQLKSYWSKLIFSGKGQPPKQVKGDAEVIQSLGANPGQIGYVAEEAVDGSVKVVYTP